jgi:hypothetical protein
MTKDTYLTPKLREGETIDLSQYSPRQRTNIRLYGVKYLNWTPADVTDYKQKWKCDKTTEMVTIDFKDSVYDKTTWCKTNLFFQDWELQKVARRDGVSAFWFKNSEDAMLFRLSNGV